MTDRRVTWVLEYRALTSREWTRVGEYAKSVVEVPLGMLPRQVWLGIRIRDRDGNLGPRRQRWYSGPTKSPKNIPPPSQVGPGGTYQYSLVTESSPAKAAPTVTVKPTQGVDAGYEFDVRVGPKGGQAQDALYVGHVAAGEPIVVPVDPEAPEVDVHAEPVHPDGEFKAPSITKSVDTGAGDLESIEDFDDDFTAAGGELVEAFPGATPLKEVAGGGVAFRPYFIGDTDGMFIGDADYPLGDANEYFGRGEYAHPPVDAGAIHKFSVQPWPVTRTITRPNRFIGDADEPIGGSPEYTGTEFTDRRLEDRTNNIEADEAPMQVEHLIDVDRGGGLSGIFEPLELGRVYVGRGYRLRTVLKCWRGMFCEWERIRVRRRIKNRKHEIALPSLPPYQNGHQVVIDYATYGIDPFIDLPSIALEVGYESGGGPVVRSHYQIVSISGTQLVFVPLITQGDLVTTNASGDATWTYPHPVLDSAGIEPTVQLTVEDATEQVGVKLNGSPTGTAAQIKTWQTNNNNDRAATVACVLDGIPADPNNLKMKLGLLGI